MYSQKLDHFNSIRFGFQLRKQALNSTKGLVYRHKVNDTVLFCIALFDFVDFLFYFTWEIFVLWVFALFAFIF